MSNSLDPVVGPDLGPNCLPRSSADDIGRQRVKDHNVFVKTYIHINFAQCVSFLQIRDGLVPKVIHCGTKLLPDFISDTRMAIVDFTSDKSVQKKGFKIAYSLIEGMITVERRQSKTRITWRSV